MASGYAILSGLLQGLGAGGEEVVQARRQALAEEKLKQDAAESALRNALLNKQLEQQQSQFDLSQKAADAKMNIPLPAEMGGGTSRAEMLPYLIAKKADADKAVLEQQQRYGQAGVLEVLGRGVPARPEMSPPDEGAMYAENTPARAEVPGIPQAALYGQLLREGPVSAQMEALLKQISPTAKYGTAAPGATVFNEATGALGATAPNRDLKEPATRTSDLTTEQGVFRITTDAQGNELNRIRVGDPRAHAPKEPPQPNATQSMIDLTRQKQALIGQGIPATDPRVRNLNEQIDNIKSYTLAPGGQVIGAGSGDPRATAPMQPSGGERSEMADLRAGIAGVDNLLNNVDKNKDVLGNFASNPVGAFRRGASTFVPGMTTAAEKQFLADLATQVAEIKRATIGATQTDTELKGLVDSLPDKGQVDISVIPRLQAIKAKLNRKLTEREAVFAPSGGTQQGGGGWGKARVVNP